MLETVLAKYVQNKSFHDLVGLFLVDLAYQQTVYQ